MSCIFVQAEQGGPGVCIRLYSFWPISILSLLSSIVLTSEGEDRKLRINGDEQDGDELAECVLAFYKGRRYDPHCSVRVFLEGQLDVDTGGVRRQIYSEVFKQLAFSDHFGLFEGPLGII